MWSQYNVSRSRHFSHLQRRGKENVPRNANSFQRDTKRATQEWNVKEQIIWADPFGMVVNDKERKQGILLPKISLETLKANTLTAVYRSTLGAIDYLFLKISTCSQRWRNHSAGHPTAVVPSYKYKASLSGTYISQTDRYGTDKMVLTLHTAESLLSVPGCLPVDKRAYMGKPEVQVLLYMRAGANRFIFSLTVLCMVSTAFKAEWLHCESDLPQLFSCIPSRDDMANRVVHITEDHSHLREFSLNQQQSNIVGVTVLAHRSL
ncbi:hypothetical protein ARMGADRAFT_1035883 [Armillaria gallica]|uniref:Uncharacterized protein n=1 Tax=Armillaria gallica TaxID=47427 RepID=A0A2H3D5U6_ARMGA|nr:hypothetical protein ARMGADRAFT_1035883 [Armillaria gallica]